jgi:hypothetical protein
MRNRSLSPCSFRRFLDVSFCSGPLFSRRHIFGELKVYGISMLTIYDGAAVRM